MSSKFSPDHYTTGRIETWDFIIDKELDFLLGNVIKYVVRAGRKGVHVGSAPDTFLGGSHQLARKILDALPRRIGTHDEHTGVGIHH